MTENKFKYNWTLKDANFTKDKGKVFSCFSCGGGSTMGYKLAGFDVIGCNEIDPRMMEVYKKNHNPKYPFLAPIQEFKDSECFPSELYDLDILDGSPPCSSFSMSGNRGKDWGKEKKFKEGQAKQVLDTLFFDFIELAEKLQPKVVIAENVKGLLLGDAIDYVIRIYEKLEKAGYYVQHFLLDASKMGVPQKRERVFFIALRKDIAQPFLEQVDMFTQQPFINLDFEEKEIPFKDIFHNYTDRPLTEHYKKLWDARIYGDNDMRTCSARLGRNPNAQFNYKFLYMHKVVKTILSGDCNLVFDYPRYLNFDELCEAGSFPKDYDFGGNPTEYIVGMSVPPIMTAQIATRVYDQWLSKIKPMPYGKFND